VSGLPATIHRYEVEARIGEGGMGTLYLARDPVLDRQVAIKLLREGFDNADLRERFVREAKSAARLTHVNIVRIFDFGDHHGQPFIAMEYIPGETLADKIRRRAQIPLAERLRYMEDLCAGLAHAHKAQIVHRDVKPANVMISPEGELKILDFGIARLGDSKMTQAGMLVGTLNYMSPEQLAGGQVDQRSDIFAVGAVFYELLAYRQAFPGGLHDGLLHKIMHAAPEPIEKFCPDLDPEISRIILRAVEKDQAARYASLTDMGRDIARVRDWLPAEATQVIATPDAATKAIPLPRPSDAGRVAKPTPRPTPPPGTPPPSDAGRRPASSADKTVPVALPKRPAPTPAPKPPATDAQIAEQKRASEVKWLLETAQKALDAGRYAEAIGAAEAVLVRTPDHAAAIALAGRARRDRQGALAQAAADAALAALAGGQIDIAERHIADGARADTDHPAILAAHVKVKEARAAAEAERARKAAEAAERERARALEAEQKRLAEEARRREEEARRRAEEEARRREEAELARHREDEAERQRAADTTRREQRVQEQLVVAEMALNQGRPDEAMTALDRAIEIDPNARVSALRVRAEALRDEQARAEEGRRQREREQRIAARRQRIARILQSRPVRIAAGALVLALAGMLILPRIQFQDPPTEPSPATPSAPVPASTSTTPASTVPTSPAAPEAPSMIARARTLYSEGKRVEALQALRTDDPDLAGKTEKSLAELWLTDARLGVASAAERALRGGARSSSSQYKEAAARRAAGDAHRQQGRLADALLAYWQAHAMYDALQPARTSEPPASDVTPSPAAAPAAKPDAPPATAPPVTTSTPSPVTTLPVQPKPQEPAPAVANPQAERDAVLRTVQEFAAAMNNRDAAAVTRLRRMNAAEQKMLEDAARNLVSYSYQLTPTGAPSIEGIRATLRCVRQQSFVDGTRRRRDQNDAVLIQLAKDGERWVIVAVTPTR
jgi:serine/threonine protein kinase/tetratricopeptide (TPR) repeat protein